VAFTAVPYYDYVPHVKKVEKEMTYTISSPTHGTSSLANLGITYGGSEWY
jgi:hypothetical protein